MQVFNVDLTDEGVQATPSTVTISTQTTSPPLETSLANILHSHQPGDSSESLRQKIDALAEGLGSQKSLLDELFQRAKSESLSESAVIRKHGPPPPYEPITPSSRWPKFLTVMENGQVASTGWMTFVLWSVVLFLMGLTTQSLMLPRHDLGGLYPDGGYGSAFEMFGQRHWWEKWGMDTVLGRVVWKVGWWIDEMLRGDGHWPS